MIFFLGLVLGFVGAMAQVVVVLFKVAALTVTKERKPWEDPEDDSEAWKGE